MKKLSLFLILFLTGCAYQNPLEKADFRFQTIVISPYVLSSWYRISAPKKPLTVYVEDYTTPPTEMMREQAVKDKGSNVAYIGRPCQYFQKSKTNSGTSPGKHESLPNSTIGWSLYP